jgi:hypothetical protein
MSSNDIVGEYTEKHPTVTDVSDSLGRHVKAETEKPVCDLNSNEPVASVTTTNDASTIDNSRTRRQNKSGNDDLQDPSLSLTVVKKKGLSENNNTVVPAVLGVTAVADGDMGNGESSDESDTEDVEGLAVAGAAGEVPPTGSISILTSSDETQSAVDAATAGKHSGNVTSRKHSDEAPLTFTQKVCVSMFGV